MPTEGDYVGRFVGTHADDDVINDNNNPSTIRCTSTKWSVLSERLEGLLTEAAAIGGVGMEEYCLRMSDLEGPIMKAIRTKMIRTDWNAEWTANKTMFAYGEEMSTDPLEGQFIKALTTMKLPKRILEVGMFAGYGAAAMLEGSPSATVVSLEIDPYLKTWVSDCLDQVSSNAAANQIMEKSAKDRLKIVTGPALETMPKLSNDSKFDLIFVDANKSEYRRYVEILLERDLLGDGAQIVVDNTLYCGMPYTDPVLDSQPARRRFGDAIKDFNAWVKDHPKLRQVILPIRDGVTVVVYDN